MTEQEIIKWIDKGANFYVSLFGKAEHMETVDTGFYTYVKPKAGAYGITFVYDIRIGHLTLNRQKELVAEIKALGMPVWLDLLADDALYRLVFEKDKVHGQTVFADQDEVYMALLPDQKRTERADASQIIRVQSAEEFALWAKLTNDLMAGGRPDLHPVYHYPLCQKGLMKCYVLYHDHTPAAVASVMDNNGIDSLEFVATVPQMRRRGFAREICARAVCDAFAGGAKIITLRAVNAAASKLYESIGFQVYNHAL